MKQKKEVVLTKNFELNAKCKSNVEFESKVSEDTNPKTIFLRRNFFPVQCSHPRGFVFLTKMKITVSHKFPACDLLFIFIPEKKWDRKIFKALLTPALEKQISERFLKKDFKGELGECFPLFPGTRGAKKTFLMGTGKGKDPVDQRKAAAFAMRKAKKLKCSHLCFLLPEKFDVHRAISGAILGNYEFKIGDKKDHFSPTSLCIVSGEKITNAEMSSEIALAEGQNFARDLVNLPPNFLTPKVLAQKAVEHFRGTPVKVEILGEKEISNHKMGSLFGVGQGSHEESQCIILKYMGGAKSEAPLGLVGKGVCFDSGGYNLKPTNHIEDMKSDMAGAAAVLGFFSWLAKTKPAKNVVGMIGAVENLISGNAFKPGDILTSMSGKTIEITNTDAEGRLVLADCLYFMATKFKPKNMIDLATLTGAAIAALGYEISGLLGNNEKLISQVKKAAEQADEPIWELPITDTFREKIKGENADLLNWTENVSAGSSMGGAFLEYFVENIPWVHLDIAGTAFHEKSRNAIHPNGATGVMVRTLSQIVQN